MRRQDIQKIEGGRVLRVTPTDDRGLKTTKSRCSVIISKRLVPILDAHLAKQDAAKALAALQEKTNKAAKKPTKDPGALFWG